MATLKTLVLILIPTKVQSLRFQFHLYVEDRLDAKGISVLSTSRCQVTPNCNGLSVTNDSCQLLHISTVVSVAVNGIPAIYAPELAPKKVPHIWFADQDKITDWSFDREASPALSTVTSVGAYNFFVFPHESSHLICGGRLTGGVGSDQCFQYSVGATNLLPLPQSKLPLPLFGANVVPIDHTTSWLLGGQTTGGGSSTATYFFHHKNMTWSLSDMPQPPETFASACVVSLDDSGSRYVFIGGGGGPTSRQARTLIVDIKSKVWHVSSNLQTRRKEAQKACFRHTLQNGTEVVIIVGGEWRRRTPVQSVEIFDIAKESWSYGPNFPVHVSRTTITKVGGKIFTFGGTNAERKVHEMDPVTLKWSLRSDLTIDTTNNNLHATVHNI